MESQTEGLVSLLGALVVEEVLDDVLLDWEQCAACRVGRRVLAIGASDAARQRAWGQSL